MTRSTSRSGDKSEPESVTEEDGIEINTHVDGGYYLRREAEGSEKNDSDGIIDGCDEEFCVAEVLEEETDIGKMIEDDGEESDEESGDGKWDDEESDDEESDDDESDDDESDDECGGVADDEKVFSDRPSAGAFNDRIAEEDWELLTNADTGIGFAVSWSAFLSLSSFASGWEWGSWFWYRLSP